MRLSRIRAVVRTVVGMLMLVPLLLVAYEVGDTTDDWSMWDGWQEVNYRLYDYRGKLVLVNLFKDT